jgi:predicted TPR repeat methyltransferase
LTARLTLKRSALLSPADDGYLLYDLDADRLHHLNPAASLIIELCDGTRDVPAIRDIVASLVGESGWPAWDEWIARAVDAGLVALDADRFTPSPMSASDLTDRAMALRDRDRVLPAFVCQQHATELAPADSQMWYRLGELAHIVGRRDEARLAFSRYLELAPGDPEIRHILTALNDEAPPVRAPDDFVEYLYARFASFYDRNMSEDLEYRGPDVLRDAIDAAVAGRRELTVLDLGCGTGLSGAAVRRLARRLVGVDLSRPMIERARQRGIYDELVVSEITAFVADSRPADAFDLMIACDTFIYFGDLRQVVVPAATRLADGGLIAFSVERGDTYPFSLTDSGRYAHHIEHLREVADDAGLSVVRLDETVLRYEYGEPVAALVAVLAAER